jgi:hypothetical protein
MWMASLFGPKRTGLLALLAATMLVGTARGDEPRLSIGGYDPGRLFYRWKTRSRQA